jgi:hypothetical protein
MYRKMIVYDRKTGDFAMYLNGELCGYAATYLQAESNLSKLVYELLSKPRQPEPHPGEAAEKLGSSPEPGLE